MAYEEWMKKEKVLKNSFKADLSVEVIADYYWVDFKGNWKNQKRGVTTAKKS